MGVPHLRSPHQTWLGGTLTRGTPPQVPPIRPGWGVPLLDLAWGYPKGVPHLRYPHQTWPGVPQQGGTSPCVPPIRPGWGVPYLRYLPPIGPGWGYPNGGWVPHLIQDNRWSTWYAAVGMPLAFTQEDFLVIHSFNLVINLFYIPIAKYIIICECSTLWSPSPSPTCVMFAVVKLKFSINRTYPVRFWLVNIMITHQSCNSPTGLETSWVLVANGETLVKNNSLIYVYFLLKKFSTHSFNWKILIMIQALTYTWQPSFSWFDNLAYQPCRPSSCFSLMRIVFC